MESSFGRVTTNAILLVAMLTLAACGGGSPAVGPGVVQQSIAHAQSVAATSSCLSSACIYVAASTGSGTRSSVDLFALDANGDVPPVERIIGKKTLLGFSQGIAVDAKHRVYATTVTSYTDETVTVYAAGAYGNTEPIQTIAGPNTGLDNPQKIAVDAKRNVYVANTANDGSPSGNNPSVTVYAAGANGNATPIRTIAGPNTGLTVPFGIALDDRRNIYVTNYSPYSVLVFAAGANGNATPVRTISGSNTGLSGPNGIAVDGSKNIYVANYDALDVTVYAAGSNGNVSPVRTIGGRKTKLIEPSGIAVDANGNMYVSDLAFWSWITVYAAGANGNVAPIQMIKGRDTELQNNYAYDIAVR